MQITPVDHEFNLFRVENILSPALAEKVLSTDWMSLAWDRQEGQELWKRRRIRDSEIPWIAQWHSEMNERWPELEQQIGFELHPYFGTAFWIDEPGFICTMHTDGEMPGSLQLTWIGSDPGLGTAFYWHKDPATLRYQVPMQPNAGYIMTNQADETGYRRLQWHAMLTPVPENSFRLTTYTWMTPK